MQVETGKTPSEWFAIHAGRLRKLTGEVQLGAYDRATIRAIDEEAAALRYWAAVRCRVHGGGVSPSVWEERARAEWRRAAAAAAAAAYGEHMTETTGVGR